ncbi:MAG: AAA family ATPase [Burkholderiales bacterium]
MNNAPTRFDAAAALIAALRDPRCYPHAVDRIEVLETHISWVILTGLYAYKIKKPVNLGFLDFATLEQRAACCHEELRLNRRLAPALYLEVVAITGSPQRPVVGGDGEALEYAVKMKQFAQEQLASRLLASGGLTVHHIGQLAEKIAVFHQYAAVAASGSRFGSPPAIEAQMEQNFEQIAALPGAAASRDLLDELRRWSGREFIARKTEFATRQAAARVRECHGDLHLGNIVLIENEITPFDCIEFSAELRWNDVASEIAFVVMDLVDRGRADFAFLFLNRYLESSGDYEAMAVLRFYLVYRAMVRAKVHCLRAHQFRVGEAERERLLGAFREYLDLAARFTHAPAPALVILHGLSGSGKSTISCALLQAACAIRVRSDVERKRLHQLAAHEHAASGIDTGIYAGTSTRRVYHRLAQLAHDILAAGWSVIVDAAFLQRWQRDLLRRVARELAVPFVIVSLQAPERVLQQRIAQRSAAGRDASDADLAVLAHQLASQQPLAAEEMTEAVVLDATQSLAALAALPAWQALVGRIAPKKA